MRAAIQLCVLCAVFPAACSDNDPAAVTLTPPGSSAAPECSGRGVLLSENMGNLCDDHAVVDSKLCASGPRARCVCNQCYEGPACSKLTDACAVDTRVAEMTLTRPWWDKRPSAFSIPQGSLWNMA